MRGYGFRKTKATGYDTVTEIMKLQNNYVDFRVEAIVPAPMDNGSFYMFFSYEDKTLEM